MAEPVLKFRDLKWRRIYVGGKDLPAHIFANCPHLKRKLAGEKMAKAYSLSANSNIRSLIRCSWCRSRFVRWTEENIEVPPDLQKVLDRAAGIH